MTEESSIGVDFQSFGRGVLVGLLVDVHVVWVFFFPQLGRGRTEVFQLPPKPIQRSQNVGFVLSLSLPIFVPPSPCRKQTAFGVFRELFFQIGLVGFRFLVGATGVGIVRVPARVAACAFREFANVGFELLDLGLFFRPVCMEALTKMICGEQSEEGCTVSKPVLSHVSRGSLLYLQHLYVLTWIPQPEESQFNSCPTCKRLVLPLRGPSRPYLSPLKVSMRYSSRSLVSSQSQWNLRDHRPLC